MLRHERDKNSPSKCYCTACYTKLKERYERIEREGGPVEGLRAVRALSGGAGFGYEPYKKELEMRAFFHYCMPHIPEEQAEKYVREIIKE